MGAGGHFCQRDAFVTPGYRVAGAGDVDGCFVVAAFNCSCGVDLKQFWVQRSSIKLKHQFSDFRSYGQHNNDP